MTQIRPYSIQTREEEGDQHAYLDIVVPTSWKCHRPAVGCTKVWRNERRQVSRNDRIHDRLVSCSCSSTNARALSGLSWHIHKHTHFYIQVIPREKPSRRCVLGSKRRDKGEGYNQQVIKKERKNTAKTGKSNDLMEGCCELQRKHWRTDRINISRLSRKLQRIICKRQKLSSKTPKLCNKRSNKLKRIAESFDPSCKQQRYILLYGYVICGIFLTWHLKIIDEISPRSRDIIVGIGEKLSCTIAAAVLKDKVISTMCYAAMSLRWAPISRALTVSWSYLATLLTRNFRCLIRSFMTIYPKRLERSFKTVETKCLSWPVMTSTKDQLCI